MPRMHRSSDSPRANSNSSLADLLAGWVATADAQSDDKGRWRRLVQELTALDADDWSGRLHVAGELKSLAHSIVNRRNSTKTLDQAIATWEKKVGLDPVKFHALTVVIAAAREAVGAKPNEALVRRAALLALRPDIRIPVRKLASSRDIKGASKQRVSALRKDADALKDFEKQLKDMLDKPSKALKQVFSQAESEMDGLVSDFRQLMIDMRSTPAKS